MSRTLLSVVVLCALGGAARAQELDAKGLVRVIAPHVNDTTQVVVHVSVAKIDLKKYFETITAIVGEKEEIAAARQMATMQRDKLLKAGINHIVAAVNIKDFRGNWAGLPEIVGVAPLGKNAEIDDLLQLLGQVPGVSVKVENNALVVRFGAAGLAQAKERAEFAEGLEALGDKHMQVIAAPSEDLRRLAAKALGAVPSDLGAADITVLTAGIRWAGVGYDTSKFTGKYVVQAKDVDTAKALKALADKGLGMLDKIPEAPPEITKIKEMLTVKQEGTRLSMEIDEKVINAVLTPAVTRVREAAARTQSQNNLKQIGIALLNYHDVNKMLPASANFDAQGKPLLSWRVHILPYLEQDGLYKQFKLNEAWDSPHNKKLIAQIPPTYASPVSKVGQEGKTTYLAVSGKGSMFEGNKGQRLANITDGLSNTIAVVEVNDTKAVYWTQPEDFAIDTKDPLAALVQKEWKGFNVLMGDVSVRFLSANVRPATLSALFTRRGGEVVNPND